MVKYKESPSKKELEDRWSVVGCIQNPHSADSLLANIPVVHLTIEFLTKSILESDVLG